MLWSYFLIQTRSNIICYFAFKFTKMTDANKEKLPHFCIFCDTNKKRICGTSLFFGFLFFFLIWNFSLPFNLNIYLLPIINLNIHTTTKVNLISKMEKSVENNKPSSYVTTYFFLSFKFWSCISKLHNYHWERKKKK